MNVICCVQREVVKLLAENPKKYRNLKVILKSENGNKFFINPLDKNLVEEEKLADKEYTEGLKELFKHFYVLPENEEIPFYTGILSDNTPTLYYNSSDRENG